MSNISYLFNFTGTWIQRECKGTEFATIECWNKLYCPQIAQQLVKGGIIIIVVSVIAYIVSNILCNKEIISRDIKDNVIDFVNSIMLLYIMLIIYLNI